MTSPTKGRHPARPRTGRRPGSPNTQEQILAAARESFAVLGYDRTSLRGVAASAGVDPALVRRYFGSKEALLVSALAIALTPEMSLASLLESDIDKVGEGLIEYFLSVWESKPGREILIATLRSACTNEAAAAILRGYLAEHVLGLLSQIAHMPDSEARAAAIASQIVGLAIVRYVVKIEPLVTASGQQLKEIFAPTLQRYATGSLGPSATPSKPSAQNR